MTVPAVQANPADVVLTFLESVGRRAEAELYLRLFRQLPKESFALIAPALTPHDSLGGGHVALQLTQQVGAVARRRRRRRRCVGAVGW